MSKTNWNAELVLLFKEINKREKIIEEGEKNKSDVSDQYKKINILIKNFIEKNNSSKANDNLTKDIIESIKHINSAYENNSKNVSFNKFLSEKEQMINKHLEKKWTEITEDKELNKEDNDFMKDFEIITLPKLNEIIEECNRIKKVLNNDIIKDDKNKNDKLNEDISRIISEANKLMCSKKLIDEDIKRLNNEINAIKKEYDKIDKKKKNMEKYIKIFECKYNI